MTYPNRGSKPRTHAALERDEDIRILEAICDVAIRRHEPKWKPSKPEFDFYGSMVRAQRIFGESKK
jgi:vancomycin permeability regulator SanA